MGKNTEIWYLSNIVLKCFFYHEMGGTTCQGDEQLTQAGTKCISSKHGTTKVTSGSLVILSWNHTVNVGKVGHLCRSNDSIVDLLMGWEQFYKDCSFMKCSVSVMHNILHYIFMHYYWVLTKSAAIQYYACELQDQSNLYYLNKIFLFVF